jgi:hypothetical protein
LTLEKDCTMMSRILYQTETVCVEYFSASYTKLAYVFSPLPTGSLSGNPDEGVRLLQHGFDVLAFKIKHHDGWQSIPPDLLKALANLAARRQYAETVAYGTALGGYAALAFSGVLKPARAMLVSPQYPDDPDNAGDTGWAISPACKFFIFFDNKSPDSAPLEQLLTRIPEGNAEVTQLPYSGHPSSACLQEAGLLAQLERTVLGQASCAGLDFSARTKGRSVAYLFNLGTALLKRNKLISALGVTQKALAINDGVWSFHWRKAEILVKLDRHEAAILALQAAIALAPNVPDLHYHLSLSLLHLDRLPEALQASNRVMALVTDIHGFWGYHSNLLWRNGLPEQSLDAILRAIELDPANAGYHAHKSGMLQALERLDESIQAASDAVALAPNNQAHVTHLNSLRLKKQQCLPPPVLPQIIDLDKLLAPWH